MGLTIHGKALMPGLAQGILLASEMPLSFWGGYEQSSGEIIDRRHNLSGEIAAGKILAFPFTKGSSTTTAIILESVRAGVAPAGFVMQTGDHFIGLACVVANEMYNVEIPLVVVQQNDFETIVSKSGAHVAISEGGVIHL
jgi:predicted aconitase with swiveling domain